MPRAKTIAGGEQSSETRTLSARKYFSFIRNGTESSRWWSSHEEIRLRRGGKWRRTVACEQTSTRSICLRNCAQRNWVVKWFRFQNGSDVNLRWMRRNLEADTDPSSKEFEINCTRSRCSPQKKKTFCALFKQNLRRKPKPETAFNAQFLEHTFQRQQTCRTSLLPCCCLPSRLLNELEFVWLRMVNGLNLFFSARPKVHKKKEFCGQKTASLENSWRSALPFRRLGVFHSLTFLVALYHRHLCFRQCVMQYVGTIWNTTLRAS